jgi:hypothetical protein
LLDPANDEKINTLVSCGFLKQIKHKFPKAEVKALKEKGFPACAFFRYGVMGNQTPAGHAVV